MTDAICYYRHESPAVTFPCFDGRSTVCGRCCIENCRNASPGWFLRCRAAGHPTWPADVRKAGEQLPSPVARKIVCLETYWGDHRGQVFGNTSVRPFMEALGGQLDPPLRIAHRFVESAAHLASYIEGPDSLLRRDREVQDAPIMYLSFHGAPGTLRSSLERVDSESLCRAFAGWGTRCPSLVYFGACSVFAGEEGEAFARRFLEASGVQAVIGYATDIDWMDSMMTDLIFLRRFFGVVDPWAAIAQIHESVLADFLPAARLGLRLFTR